MSFVGLKYAAYARVEKEMRGQPMTYKPGIVLGRMIGANVDWERNSNPLYADDTNSEDDNSIIGGKIGLNLDDLSDEAQVEAVGVMKVGDPGSEEYIEAAKSADYGGVGYIRVRRKNNVTTYVAYWIYKTLLAMVGERATTRNKQIAWQTPNVEGSIMGVVIGEDGVERFRTHRTFATEAEARTWINTKANIKEE